MNKRYIFLPLLFLSFFVLTSSRIWGQETTLSSPSASSASKQEASESAGLVRAKVVLARFEGAHTRVATLTARIATASGSSKRLSYVRQLEQQTKNLAKNQSQVQQAYTTMTRSAVPASGYPVLRERLNDYLTALEEIIKSQRSLLALLRQATPSATMSR